MEVTKIIKVKGDWKEVFEDCLFTMGKPSKNKEPSVTWKKKILISEHSPIRDISFKWDWINIKHWVTVHWVRHKWEKFVRTQRTDRTGIDRSKLSQDEPQDFRGEANIQHLIDTMRKRLCFCASPETREYAESLKLAVHEIEPEIANVFVPNCVYRCGCPEKMQNQEHPCVFFNCLCAINPEVKSTDIQARYDVYNNFFYKNHSKISPPNIAEVTGGDNRDL